MRFAHDVYAETNPAFYTFVLAAFVKAFLTINEGGADLATVYLALPLALSGDFVETFEGTNKNTGLREWLERSPKVQVGLADRVNDMMDVVTEAIRFASFASVLSVDGVCLKFGTKRLKVSAVKVLDEEAASAIKRAERLGYWFATAGSTRNIFDILGLTV